MIFKRNQVALKWFASFLVLLSAASTSMAWQISDTGSLKPTRDPYFNPKQQGSPAEAASRHQEGNSIIRTAHSPPVTAPTTEVVGDFVADLSQLQRTVQAAPQGFSPVTPAAHFQAVETKESSFTQSPESFGAAPKAEFQASLQDRVPAHTVSSSQAVAAPSPSTNPLEPTRLLAMVGNEPIFVGDMLFELNQMLDRHLPNAPQSVRDRELTNGVAMMLDKYVDSKLLYIDTLRKLPEGVELDKILEQAAKEFDDTALKALMEGAGIRSVAEFDAKLRMNGSSLRKMRQTWSRDQLTRYFVGQQLEVDKEVTHRELLEEYKKHHSDYAIPARARWEQIMVRTDRAGSRAEAERQLVEMGNKLINGANFGAMAKKGSHGFTADNGGLHDWTTKGALASKVLDQAIFSEPVGELSNVIETPEGFHIIRVIERTEATYVPFEDAQGEIKERILENKRQAEFNKYIERLRTEIPVVYYSVSGEPEERSANHEGPMRR